MDNKTDDVLSELGNNRADFMKRWFAIAISVGFATALSNMPWLKDGVIFDRKLAVDWNQVEQGARLATALVATILSWDGYFQSIRNKPITDGPRFSIDIFLVVLYLFLLLTSKFDYFWLWIHAAAFIFYCFWDFLSMRKHPRAYVTELAPKSFMPKVSEIYRGCFFGNDHIYKGPAITLMWPVYFWAIAVSHQFILSSHDRQKPITVFIHAIMIITGLFLYRYDKKKQFTTFSRSVKIAIGVGVILTVDMILRTIT